MKKEIWLLISGFGIMFAFFSWLQEAKIIESSEEIGYLKGVYALISGFFLYVLFRKNL